MKYAVVGLGAVGSVIGGLLAKHHKDVILIGKQKQVDDIREHEFLISINKDKITLKEDNITTDSSSIKDVDVVLLCVKSQDTKTCVEEFQRFLNDKKVIVSLQNGIRNHDIIQQIINNDIISSVILFNSIYIKPGEVTLTINNGIVLEDNISVSKNIAKDFNEIGFKTTLVENIKGNQWSKLIVNLQIAISALTNQTVIESIVNKDSRVIISETMSEGVRIVEESGIKLEKLPQLDPQKMIRRLKNYNSFMLKIGSRLLGVSDNARNSIWQSLERNKKTEIDYINGEIVALAKNNHLSAPINKKLVDIIKNIEHQQMKKYFEPHELRNLLGL
jgi:2-dehydropantoate 2-reductase